MKRSGKKCEIVYQEGISLEELLRAWIGMLDVSFNRDLGDTPVRDTMRPLTVRQLQYLDTIGQLTDPAISELATALCVSKPTTTVGVRRLARSGLVEKVPSRLDRRKVDVKLTETGANLAQAKRSAIISYGDVRPYVALGKALSDAGQDARVATFEHYRTLVMNALRQAGRRGVLAVGWNNSAGSGMLSDDMFVLESAPHAWLFPRMAAVVHHGAGVPCLILSHSNVSFTRARRVFGLGVGPAPIERKKLGIQLLPQAIQSLYETKMRKEAESLGRLIREENGAQHAANVIISTLKQNAS